MNRRDEPAAGWVVTPLGELLTRIESGKSFQCDERPPVAGEVGVVKVSAVSWGEYREQESKTCTSADRVNADYFIRPGDFLFSRANTIELVGACVVAKRVTLRVMLSDKILRLQFAWDGLKPWLLHFLGSKAGRLQIETLASGNQESMRNIGQERLGQIRVPLPPLAEQARIVAKLEELLSELDAGVAELTAAQAKLQRYRQSLLKAAVEGALTADWRARNPPQETGAELLTRILRERRAQWEALQLQRFARAGKKPPAGWQSDYVQPAEPVATGLPHLPVGWVWASLDQLLVSMRSGTAATSGRQPTGHPVLKSSAVRQGSIDFNALNYLDAEQSTRDDNCLELGDLLITRLSGSLEYVGCCAVVRELPAARMQYPDRIFCGKTVLPDRCLTEQIAMCFQAPLVRSLIETAAKSTAGHKRISLSDLPTLPIALPPVSEIAAISELVEAAMTASVETELSVQAGLRLAAAQRQNILCAAFAGQLVPQDPGDEPASALLARIRAERAQHPPAVKRTRRSPPQAATP